MHTNDSKDADTPATEAKKLQSSKKALKPSANNQLEFSIKGPGEIIATDNGDPSDLTSFVSKKRQAFNGLALVIVRSKLKEKRTIQVTIKSNGLQEAVVTLKTQ